MTTIYRLVAWLRGWAEARDADDGTLVVFHDGHGIHYSGPDAWKLAAHHQ